MRTSPSAAGENDVCAAISVGECCGRTRAHNDAVFSTNPNFYTVSSAETWARLSLVARHKWHVSHVDTHAGARSPSLRCFVTIGGSTIYRCRCAWLPSAAQRQIHVQADPCPFLLALQPCDELV